MIRNFESSTKIRSIQSWLDERKKNKFFYKGPFTRMSMLGINSVLIEREVSKAQQYLKMDPSNSSDLPSILPVLRSFQYNYNYYILFSKELMHFNGLCQQVKVLIYNIKYSIVLLPFCINSLIRVVPVELCGYLSQHHLINFTSRIITNQANVFNQFFRNNF